MCGVGTTVRDMLLLEFQLNEEATNLISFSNLQCSAPIAATLLTMNWGLNVEESATRMELGVELAQ